MAGGITGGTGRITGGIGSMGGKNAAPSGSKGAVYPDLPRSAPQCPHRKNHLLWYCSRTPYPPLF